jgi:hypothetical protein
MTKNRAIPSINVACPPDQPKRDQVSAVEDVTRGDLKDWGRLIMGDNNSVRISGKIFKIRLDLKARKISLKRNSGSWNFANKPGDVQLTPRFA